jgi:3-oxoacyl-[acyl-carrier-protein] synthase II
MNPNRSRRVVVTGLGIVSPVGIGLSAAWASITAGQSGVAKITKFDASAYNTQFAAEVKGFDPAQYMSGKEVRRFDTFIHYALAAAKEALTDAGIAANPDNAERYGVNIGSGIGGLPMIEETAYA